jgi:hypothetical protein
MTREKHPFSHEDISLLAKSLKKQLSDRDQLPGHLELLNMLARATGKSNYQSWLASRALEAGVDSVENSSSTLIQQRQHEVEIVFRISQDRIAAKEVFERDDSGRVRDRRHEPVSRVLALFDVSLMIEGAPESVARFRASAKPSLLPDGEEPERWFLPFLPRALANLVATAPNRLSIFGSVDLPLDDVIELGPASPLVGHSTEVPVAVARLQRDRLAHECLQADQCTQGFRQVKELLWEIFGVSSPRLAVQTYRTPMSQIAKYLRDYLEAEGDMFMGAWNEEKVGRAARLLERAVTKPRAVTKNDWKWARQDIYVASPPNHWERSALPPPALFAGIEESAEGSLLGADTAEPKSSAVSAS